jgi:hypothetical protein
MPARPWIVVLVRPQFFNRDGVREAGSGRYLKSVIISECRLSRRLAATLFESKNPHLLGRGLEPHLRVLFSAVFHVFPRGISIRVEACGSERKQKCGELWSIYVQSFYVF